MKTVKLGIIGTNFVSDWLCDGVKKCDGIINHAVYSRREETGRAFADKHGIETVYTDMEAFLSSDIDAVYIASPNICHYAQAEAAMRHGKHVLVEKPAALTKDDFISLEKIARENGVVILEAMRPAHDPAIHDAISHLSDIGTIRRAVFEFCQYSSRYDKFKAGEILNAFNPKMGNAAVMDIGVYPLHVCAMFFGEPNSIRARSTVLHNGFEGMGSVILDYGEIEAEVVYSKIADSVNPSAILGEDGAITIGKLSMGENVRLIPRSGEPKEISGVRGTDNMVYEIADFVRIIRGDTTVDYWNKLTEITLGIIDEIRKQNSISFK